MKLWHLAAGAAVLLLTYALGAGWIPLGGGASCARDEAIEAPLRTRSAEAARTFFTAILKGDAKSAYAMTSAALKARVPADKFDALVKQTLASGPFGNLSLQHSYQLSRGGEGTGRVYCGEGMAWTAFNAKADATQVHVVSSASTPAHQWALSAWLIQDGERFEVESFHAGIAGIAGRSAEDLMQLAREQDAKGHRLNAYMLLSAASATAFRGPDMQLSLKPQVDAALGEMPVPAELKGNPPRVWKMGGHSYEVEQVTIVGSESELGLVIQYRDATWDASDLEGEKRNRALIHDFISTHASYAETFGFVVARLLRPNEEEGWGTVFNATGGYAAPMPEPGVAPPAAVPTVTSDDGEATIDPPLGDALDVVTAPPPATP